MPSKPFGRFYFRLTTNGNLLGEFYNNDGLIMQTESADRRGKDEPPDQFDATYHSTWHEPNDTDATLATLVIKRQGQSQIYELEWTVAGHKAFHGQAMAAEGLLIGDYQKFEPKNDPI